MTNSTTHFDNSRPTILCGYGHLGQEIARNAQSCGVNVAGVFDNHYKIDLDSLPTFEIGIFRPDRVGTVPNAVDPYRYYNFVICAIRHQARTELRQQLEDLGAKHIYHASDLLRCYPNLTALARPGIGDDCAKALNTRQLYSDKRSIQTLTSIVHSWAGQAKYGDTEDAIAFEEPIDNIDDIYFPDFIRPLSHEVFVDVGAFTGDTVQSFIEHRRGEYGHIVAVEPDTANHERLRQYAERVGNMATFNGALSDHNGQVTFISCSDMSSRPGEGGSVVCATMDYLMETMDLIPTLIKCDVEGGEMSVLEGARETIKNYLPVLAVVCYHKPEDLYVIPKIIQEIAPGYKLFLRKYAGEWWESCLYAVPSDRVVWENV